MRSRPSVCTSVVRVPAWPSVLDPPFARPSASERQRPRDRFRSLARARPIPTSLPLSVRLSVRPRPRPSASVHPSVGAPCAVVPSPPPSTVSHLSQSVVRLAARRLVCRVESASAVCMNENASETDVAATGKEFGSNCAMILNR